jgi:alkylation response protein AidB-like acyl-CoA dehydrogenase
VPGELGGGGATHTELCELVRELAHHCPSTALVLSMHTHLVAAAVWRWRHQGAGEAMLRRVATEELGLVSTGATDWVDSNGTMKQVDGGYLVSARKVFGSGCAAADLMITSARFDDPDEGPLVLHFPVPFAAEGVRLTDDWDAHGMRGTGSHTVVLDEVFVPDAAISLRRPRGVWPPVLNVVVTVAMPIIMSVYLGVAETAVAIARRHLQKRAQDPDAQRLAGEIF